MKFFADTFYWIALTDPRDGAYLEVIRLTGSLAPRSVITTDEVLTEFLAFCSSDQRLRRQAGLEVERLINDPDIRVIPQTRDTFLAGLALYNARPDKEYSLTDCISMETMRREGLTEVLTNDKHFDQEGFRRLQGSLTGLHRLLGRYEQVGGEQWFRSWNWRRRSHHRKRLRSFDRPSCAERPGVYSNSGPFERFRFSSPFETRRRGSRYLPQLLY